jgi:non-ribosomal peptide synthetase component F
MFAMQNMDVTAIEIPGLKLKEYDYERKTAKFDLTLVGIETQEKLLFSFEYSTKLFTKETIKRFIRYFKKTVSCVLERPDAKISGIEVTSEEEKNQILYEFNDTGVEYPQSKVMHELFAEQVERSPDHIAVVEPGYPSGIS